MFFVDRDEAWEVLINTIFDFEVHTASQKVCLMCPAVLTSLIPLI